MLLLACYYYGSLRSRILGQTSGADAVGNGHRLVQLHQGEVPVQRRNDVVGGAAVDLAQLMLTKARLEGASRLEATQVLPKHFWFNLHQTVATRCVSDSELRKGGEVQEINPARPFQAKRKNASGWKSPSLGKLTQHPPLGARTLLGAPGLPPWSKGRY